MKVTINLRSGIGPLNLDLDGDEDQIFAQVKDAMTNGTLLDLTDTRGDRVIISGKMIGFVLSPTDTSHKVGFGRL